MIEQSLVNLSLIRIRRSGVSGSGLTVLVLCPGQKPKHTSLASQSQTLQMGPDLGGFWGSASVSD